MRHPALLAVVLVALATVGCSSAAVGTGAPLPDAAAGCEPGVRYECACVGQVLKGSALCSASGARGGCDCQGATPEPTDDAGGAPDASCDAPATYYRDNDGDGYGSGVPTLACAAPAGYVTNADDCDDADDRAHPGQTGFFGTPRKSAGGFDFDCSGSETREFEIISGCDLVSAGPAGGYRCAVGAAGGWSSDAAPACGVVAPWYLGCLAGCAAQTDPRAQGCR